MKLLVLYMLIVLLHAPVSYAYIDVSDVNDAEATASMQNTNLYKLNTITQMKLKGMRKINEAVKANPELLHSLDNTKIQSIINKKTDINDKKQVELDKVLQDVVNRTKDTRQLIVDISDNYQNIIKASQQSIKDKEKIILLKQQIRRVR